MKKVMLILCICSVMLSACTLGRQEYERSSKPGRLIPITLQTTLDRLKKDDTFVLLISQTTCGACKQLKAVLEPYLSEHEVTIYELVLDQEVKSREEFVEAQNRLNEYVKSFEGTPALYYIKEGRTAGEIIGYDTRKGITPYDQFVQEFQLDVVKPVS